MIARISLGIGAACLGFVALLAVNTLRIGPPHMDDPSPPSDIVIDKESASERLAEAVRFRTISHGIGVPIEKAAFVGFRDYLTRNFPRVHAALKRETVDHYSLLYTWPGSDPNLKPILLLAHMDVVPADPDTGKWTHPPFAGDIADGFIWGRGTLDMKATLVGILEAIEHALGKNLVPRRTVYLGFGHDEELGGTNGAAKIAELLTERGVRLDFTLDEGLVITHGIVPGVAKPAALIGLAEKGKVTLELTTTGEGWHSSMPPRDTVIGRLARAIERLEANPAPAVLRSPASEMFEYLGPEMSLTSRVVLANRWLLGPLLLSKLEASRATNALIRTTAAPTMIEGGIAANVLPTSAKATVDFRILPGDSIEGVINRVGAIIDDVSVSLRQVGSEPSESSPVSDSRAASFIALRTTIAQVFPDAVVAPSLMIGRTDSRRFAGIAESSYRFQPVRLAKDDLKRMHGIDERIAVENYVEIIRFYVQLLINTAIETRS